MKPAGADVIQSVFQFESYRWDIASLIGAFPQKSTSNSSANLFHSFSPMSPSSLERLLEIARTDTALRMALDGAASTDELRAIALQRNISLDDADVQQWLERQSGQGGELDPDFLADLSRGLSDIGDAEDFENLSEDALSSISGGQAGGEAVVSEIRVGFPHVPT
jgi:bacteriocin-like protein